MKHEFSTVKKLGFVFDLLRVRNIHSAAEFRTLIDGMNSLDLGVESIDGPVTFKIFRRDDLLLDEENRWYGEEFEHRRVIFDCEELILRNTSLIKLEDCIFLGSLNISRGSDDPTKISMDSCIVEEKLLTRPGEHKLSSEYLTDVFCKKLLIVQSNLSDLSIDGCGFDLVEMKMVRAETFNAFGNRFGELRTSECTFDKVSFQSQQLDFRRMRSGHFLEKIFQRRSKYDAFSAHNRRHKGDEYWDKISTDERVQSEIESYDFLLDQTAVSHSKRDAAQIRYLRTLAESQTKASRFFVFATGAFLKPARMLFISFSTVAVFAAIYMLPLWQFGVSGASYSIASSLRLRDAMYFSGVTFTTLGYGDISPLGGVRMLAVIEALLGIVLSSSFAVAITRRYID